MTTFSKYIEILPSTLQYGDKIIFKIHEKELLYGVGRKCLVPLNGNKILDVFDLLDIENPHNYCSSCYLYKDSGGIFPEFKDGDFLAAKSLIIALFTRIERFYSSTIKNTEINIDSLLLKQIITLNQTI